MSAAAATTLAGLQCSIASLADRMAALPRRLDVSTDSLITEAPRQAEGLAAAGREAAFDCGVLASNSCKALEAVAEEARVRAAQLEAYAELLEMEAEDGEESGVEAAALTLLSYSSETAPPRHVVAVSHDTAALFSRVMDAGMRVRDGIGPFLCTVSGEGLERYQAGDVDNLVSVEVVDGNDDAVDSIETEDVMVTLSLQGARVCRLAVTEPGIVEVAYHVPECSVEPITLAVNVCGVSLPDSPWTVTCPLGDSAILASLARERVAAFVCELSDWLPERIYTLLYRGSRDGMTAAAFHALCDGKGPTLVLVRCDKGFVFGGYAGASWESNYKSVASRDAFVLSVFGPQTSVPVKFPVTVALSAEALRCHPGSGPWFRSGLQVAASGYAPTALFDIGVCDIGTTACYRNVLKKGAESLTGSHMFVPRELEVFAVTRR